jgi:hypothetical protein
MATIQKRADDSDDDKERGFIFMFLFMLMCIALSVAVLWWLIPSEKPTASYPSG